MQQPADCKHTDLIIKNARRYTMKKVLNKITAWVLAAVIAGSLTVSMVFADSSTSWNFGNTNFNNLGTITVNTGVNNLGLYASQSKPMSIVSDSQSLNGTSTIMLSA